jgi:hypothetical protein
MESISYLVRKSGEFAWAAVATSKVLRVGPEDSQGGRHGQHLSASMPGKDYYGLFM